MKNLEGRLKKLEKSHRTEGPDIYLLKWGETALVTKAVYGDSEFYRADGESFDMFQSRVSDEIKRLPCNGAVRVIDVWMDSATRAEMETEDIVTAAYLR